MRMTVLLWCALLPFALVPPVGAAAIPIASALAFVVIKMDDVSVEIQDPFGLHLSDIDVSSATESLVLSLLALLVQTYKS
jgi:predicted membrane chloride channel (bestrophin family)